MMEGRFRFYNELMPKGQCRKCNHCHWYDSSSDPFQVWECLDCPCPTWIPKDNLKYLEWKYEKSL